MAILSPHNLHQLVFVDHFNFPLRQFSRAFFACHSQVTLHFAPYKLPRPLAVVDLRARSRLEIRPYNKLEDHLIILSVLQEPKPNPLPKNSNFTEIFILYDFRTFPKKFILYQKYSYLMENFEQQMCRP